MAAHRVSPLQRRILLWLLADHQRSRGMLLSAQEALVKALRREKTSIHRSLGLLEARGWITIDQSPEGNAQHLTLTEEGHTRAVEVKKHWYEDRG